MMGRRAEAYRGHPPAADGVIADIEAAEQMIKYFIRKAGDKRRAFASPGDR